MTLSFKRILIKVVIFHFLAFFFLYFVSGSIGKSVSKKKIAINTIVMREPKAQEKKLSPKVEHSFFKSDVRVKEKEPSKKKDFHISNKPKIINKPKSSRNYPAPKINFGDKKKSTHSQIKKTENKSNFEINPKKSRAVLSQNLLKKLNDELSDFDVSSTLKKKEPNLKVPSLSELEITKISIFSELGTKKSGFIDGKGDGEEFHQRVVEFFKTHLKLPEYGEVKIKMKIVQEGKIAELKVLYSQSKKNEEYLKDALDNISLSWINDFFSNGEQLELVVSFTNDI